MAKYTVTFSCGHTGTVELLGASAERERKIEHFQEQGICSECYKAEQKAKQEATPLTLTVEALPFEQKILLSFDGNTMPHKDDIKAAGFYWGEAQNGGLFGGLSMSSPKKCWHKYVALEAVDDIVKSLKALNPVVKNKVTQADIMAFADVKAKKEAQQVAVQEKKEQIKSKIADIEKPVVPAKIDGKKFNGKIYGKQGNYTIYPDSVKTSITDAEAKEIEDYLKAVDNYNRKVAEIKNA